ncbi:peptidase inhibitor family I36 protein [Streptomyces sp. XD-27]|uniref:peptidase inhibitor family I36 protein n=1 Tax=Streptomyces sp. XD-27 TaxID=3062779 RepID=UPI0026F45C70|nr:peptidase inhibitor family I36 protein [Streptomyces sp. XD-27]WKX71621.1 peptidase inhibitor family I36 protein [Streptomyces sp. XD-27]
MKRKVVGALGALSLSAVALVGSGTAAQAQGDEAASTGDLQRRGASCQSVSLCLYEHDDYEGKRVVIPARKIVTDLRDLGFDNMASSMANLTHYDVTLYQFAHYSGVRYIAKNGSTDADFTNNDFDNKASSLYWDN